MSRTEKTDWAELYKDRDVQILLGKFLSGEIGELEPTYDRRFGYHYPIIEAIVGDATRAEAFLNKLHVAGMLEKKLHDKMVHCPMCNSAEISVHYCCPYCKSFDIHKSALIEHVKCGYMDTEENFQRDRRLVCPKCHEQLEKQDLDFRRAGIWCNCRNCNRSFDIPIVTHFCRDCHGDFTFEDIVVKDVFAYDLDTAVREEAGREWILISPIRDFLGEEGFEVEGPAFIRGKSGADHMFDIVARRRNKQEVVVIDLATSAETSVSEQPVIAMFAKVFDVSPTESFLFAVPKINENGKKMAELYNICVIDARNQKEAMDTLRKRWRFGSAPTVEGALPLSKTRSQN